MPSMNPYSQVVRNDIEGLLADLTGVVPLSGELIEMLLAKQDLEPVLAAHRGTEALRQAVEGASSPGALLSVFGRYIQFNSAFGPGLANLAGEIAARQGLFRDPDEPLRLVADRAAEVASDFFYAAIDEFDDRLTPWRDTHRTLAQATLKAMGAWFGYTPRQLNDVIRINPATEASIVRVSVRRVSET